MSQKKINRIKEQYNRSEHKWYYINAYYRKLIKNQTNFKLRKLLIKEKDKNLAIYTPKE